MNRNQQLSADNTPPCWVYVDGKQVKDVSFVDPDKMLLHVFYRPLKLDKHKKTVRTFVLRAKKTIEIRPILADTVYPTTIYRKHP